LNNRLRDFKQRSFVSAIKTNYCKATFHGSWPSRMQIFSLRISYPVTVEGRKCIPLPVREVPSSNIDTDRITLLFKAFLNTSDECWDEKLSQCLRTAKAYAGVEVRHPTFLI
jgi:hypothetical protein